MGLRGPRVRPRPRPTAQRVARRQRAQAHAPVSPFATLHAPAQELDDHCHMPTLRVLPRDTHIVANPGAAQRIEPLGFKNVQVIDHKQSVDVAGGGLACGSVR